jgi:ABC-type nitrate/sulfonate/bicarbonate transport system permease component
MSGFRQQTYSDQVDDYIKGRILSGDLAPDALNTQVAIAAELIAANTGLGFLITMGRRLTMPDMVVLGMILVGLTGFIIGVTIDAVEKKLLAVIRR